MTSSGATGGGLVSPPSARTSLKDLASRSSPRRPGYLAPTPLSNASEDVFFTSSESIDTIDSSDGDTLKPAPKPSLRRRSTVPKAMSFNEFPYSPKRPSPKPSLVPPVRTISLTPEMNRYYAIPYGQSFSNPTRPRSPSPPPHMTNSPRQTPFSRPPTPSLFFTPDTQGSHDSTPPYQSPFTRPPTPTDFSIDNSDTWSEVSFDETPPYQTPFNRPPTPTPLSEQNSGQWIDTTPGYQTPFTRPPTPLLSSNSASRGQVDKTPSYPIPITQRLFPSSAIFSKEASRDEAQPELARPVRAVSLTPEVTRYYHQRRSPETTEETSTSPPPHVINSSHQPLYTRPPTPDLAYTPDSLSTTDETPSRQTPIMTRQFPSSAAMMEKHSSMRLADSPPDFVEPVITQSFFTSAISPGNENTALSYIPRSPDRTPSPSERVTTRVFPSSVVVLRKSSSTKSAETPPSRLSPAITRSFFSSVTEPEQATPDVRNDQALSRQTYFTEHSYPSSSRISPTSSVTLPISLDRTPSRTTQSQLRSFPSSQEVSPYLRPMSPDHTPSRSRAVTMRSFPSSPVFNDESSGHSPSPVFSSASSNDKTPYSLMTNADFFGKLGTGQLKFVRKTQRIRRKYDLPIHEEKEINNILNGEPTFTGILTEEEERKFVAEAKVQTRGWGDMSLTEVVDKVLQNSRNTRN